jgi:hypothetical protein
MVGAASEEDGVTWGEDNSIGKQVLRKALNERWQYVGGKWLRIQAIDGVEHWDYFEDGRREEGASPADNQE